MSQVINLNKARKTRDKAVRKAQAAENRAVFGLAKEAKTLSAAEKQKTERLLDGHKRED